MKKYKLKCIHCKKIFIVHKLRDYHKRKFCGNSCSASYNNPRKHRKAKKRPCSVCGTMFIPPKNYLQRMRCDKCFKENKFTRTSIKPRYKNYIAPDISEMTKGKLFKSRKSWQSARSAITIHAIVTYHTSNQPKKCIICNYSKHIHICHKKPVSKFSNKVLIKTINSTKNLIALYPNHHWEFDQKLLQL